MPQLLVGLSHQWHQYLRSLHNHPSRRNREHCLRLSMRKQARSMQQASRQQTRLKPSCCITSSERFYDLSSCIRPSTIVSKPAAVPQIGIMSTRVRRSVPDTAFMNRFILSVLCLYSIVLTHLVYVLHSSEKEGLTHNY